MSATKFSPAKLTGVLSDTELRRQLCAVGQAEWCTATRVAGLQRLINHVADHKSAGGVSISLEWAGENFSSKMKRRKSPGTVREPLMVLCLAGILVRVQEAKRNWCAQRAAVYALAPGYQKAPKQIVVNLPRPQVKRRDHAFERRERLVERSRARRYPFLAKLEEVLRDGMRVAPGCHDEWTRLANMKNFKGSMERVIGFMGGLNHLPDPDHVGQVTTPFSSLPKVAWPLLRFFGEKIVHCDISYAHHCFFPALIDKRIAYLRSKHGDLAEVWHYEAERKKWLTFLNEGDYYAKFCKDPNDPKERAKVKQLVNIAMNSPTKEVADREAVTTGKKSKRRNPMAEEIYWRIQSMFPYTIRICEDIKRENHRELSTPLRRFTADAINGSVIESLERGIPCGPLVDQLWCREQDSDEECEIVGRNVDVVSPGVCACVGGVRFQSVADALPQGLMDVREVSERSQAASVSLNGDSHPGSNGDYDPFDL